MAIEWDKNTLLLLHGETLEDSSFYKVPIANNGVQVSKDQSKFGRKSLYFDGTNSYIQFLSSVVDFGESDFTFDWWEYPLGISGTVFCSQNVGSTGMILAYDGYRIRLNSDYTSTGWDLINNEYAFDGKELNKWTHWAVVRHNDVLKVYRDGTLNYEKTIGAVSLKINTEKTAQIGTNPGINSFFNGYIEEFRISDVARWTTDFQPPTSPYNPSTGSDIQEPEHGDEPVDPSEFSSKLNWSVSDYLNHDDLTRIERNCKILNDKLREYGYIAPIDFRKWAVGEYPTPTQLERIRSNINALQDVWFAVPEWRELMAAHRPDGRETINAEQVNAQEWDLQQMHDYLQAMVKVFELKQAGTQFMIAGGVLNAG